MSDAVVVGAGPNGLVAANLLADAGWEVTVLESNAEPGGAVSSSGALGPGWTLDVCSAFYPLAALSPAVESLGLEAYGLRWRHAPAVLGQTLDDGGAAVIHRDLDRTAAGLGGDGDAWRDLVRLWEELRSEVVEALFTPFPPVRAGLRMGRRLKVAGAARMARFLALPVRRLAEERFGGPGATALLAGSALHADLAPEAAGSGIFGWLMAMLAQDVGFPVPEGGAGRLSRAMADRLIARGGRILCGQRAVSVVVEGGRAAGVRTAEEGWFPARRAVLADVDAPRLFRELVTAEHLPPALGRDLGSFQWDWSTFKVDWALSGAVPWAAEELSGCGTVHLGDGIDDITRYAAELARQRIPRNPFLILGQMTTSDPTRSPAGTEQASAYTHVPRTVRGDAGGAGITGAWSAAEVEAFADRVEEQVERYAPGFRSLVIRRHVMAPADLEAHDANLVGGAINGGTASVHQQLLFRPTVGLGRPETPVEGLYLASASAHPGGGVHGACGANAARVALQQGSWRGRISRPLLAAADRAVKAPPALPL
ncbi:MAG TPA: NAD(P)/FAD-dependent oxidoreductase [Acidimicrobiales bacterium]|nr:NAD(P)/FAD-dependent oxidoreductase [Acidimicrobiales bacterium]